MRELLDNLAGTASDEWVFPDDRATGPFTVNDLWTFWIKARDRAAIVADAPLQDPHRSHASHAVISGETLYVTRQLPEHRGAGTANCYAYLDDATLSEAYRAGGVGHSGEPPPIIAQGCQAESIRWSASTNPREPSHMLHCWRLPLLH